VYTDENADDVCALVDEFPRFEGWPSESGYLCKSPKPRYVPQGKKMG
jgi:hypothetical protein